MQVVTKEIINLAWYKNNISIVLRQAICVVTHEGCFSNSFYNIGFCALFNVGRYKKLKDLVLRKEENSKNKFQV